MIITTILTIAGTLYGGYACVRYTKEIVNNAKKIKELKQ